MNKRLSELEEAQGYLRSMASIADELILKLNTLSDRVSVLEAMPHPVEAHSPRRQRQGAE